MKNKIKDIIIALFLGNVLNYVEQSILESSFLLDFIKDNLVMLLIALLAINSTTLALVMTKIKDLIDKTNRKDSFQKTKKEMLFSLRQRIRKYMEKCCRQRISGEERGSSLTFGRC